jgi:hypothetical protein
MKTFKTFAYLITTILFLGISSTVIAGEYAGSWLLYDTHGGGFEAKLSEDGSASGTHGKDMKYGSWKEVDGAAVVTWKTGWTTRISKEGDKYVKTSYKPGTTVGDTPTDSSEAKKKGN